MRRPTITFALLAAAFAASPAATRVAAQDKSGSADFTWDGAMAPGRVLVVRNINGAIRVTRADGDRASVTGVKRWRRGNPADVRIEQMKGSTSGDIVICAFWSDNGTCDERSYHARSDRGWPWNNSRNDVSVEFTIRLPAGVRVVVATVNGDVSVDEASAEVEASSVNGSVWAASSGGPVRAETVNGDVRARMGTRGTGDLQFKTVNGTVIVQVPDGADAELAMSTVNGSVQSDFPVTIQGRLNPRKLRATLGKGGPQLVMKTVNGDVRLRRLQ